MLHELPNTINLDIWIDLLDEVLGTTVIKHRAQVYQLRYAPMERKVEVLVQKYPYAANADGTFGDSLASREGFMVVSKTVTASNNYLVDCQTAGKQGMVLATIDVLTQTDSTGNTIDPFAAGGALWDAVNNKEFEVMRDYDFYKLMAATQPVLIDQMVTQTVIAANQRGII